ncbi:MAG: 3-keto-5-aminohexanoate cleavage protein, partial [Alphaproteobacteria bacterium]
ACLREAWRNGGKCRIGFENSVLRSDGELAEDNAERVRDLVSALSESRS